MTQFNRRTFLGSSAAITGTLAAAGALQTPVAAANTAGTLAGTTPVYGPASGVAKLNANENPYGPSKAALVQMYEASKMGAYYVGDSVATLKSMIAERNNVTPEHISLSSGSSGVLAYLAVAVSQQGKMLGPDLFWDTTAKVGVRQGGEIKRLPKTDDLGIDLDAMYAAITPDVALAHVTNPNNPTGSVLDTEELQTFCKKASKKTKVLLDEAYNELTDDPEANSMVGLINDGYDVLVARTFSKIYGLAGMRVGYMIASPENIELINRYGLGDYAMNQAGVAAAVASYNDWGFLEMSKSKILEARQMIEAALKTNGLSALPSETSFLLVNLGELDAEIFREKMAEQNVLIRGIYRDYTSWSRVSMGKLDAVQMYVDALPKALEETHKAMRA